MSVLSFPRIYFKGFIGWDPCTFNNNDFTAFQTFDATNAALNWSFLSGVTPSITPANFQTEFRPWAIALQQDSIDSPSGPRVAAEWNMFGSHGVQFVQYNNYTTQIVGGATAYNTPAATDPLVGQTVNLLGDSAMSQAKLVDTNPSSFWSSQIFFNSMQIGGGDYQLSGPCTAKMHSRWINMNRLYDPGSELTQPAAKFSACFQACIPTDAVTWVNGQASGTPSPLLTALQTASTASGAQGIMIRFTAYVNMYFRNGILNGIPQQPRNYTELAACLKKAWDAWNNDGDTSFFFAQPCYSHVVGTAGVWNNGELASAPLGRALFTSAPVAPPCNVPSAPAPVPLAPAAAQVQLCGETNVLSLDFGSALPEVAQPGTTASDLTKVDFGPLTVGVQSGNTITPIGTIDYSAYNKAAYETSAGIIDLEITAAQAAQLQSGTLVVQTGSGTSAVTALAENVYSAQTDDRGIYLDQTGAQEFTITVQQQGSFAANAQVMLVQYDGNLNVVPLGAVSYLNFTSGVGIPKIVTASDGTPTLVTIVTADSNGVAMASVEARTPGMPVIAFFPFAAGADAVLPVPPPGLFPSGPGNYYYATARVLPFDDAVPQQFIDLWNSTQDRDQAWTFVYNNILYVYDMIFSVMLQHVDLGNRTAVEQNAVYLAQLIGKKVAEQRTKAMPVTRDLSDGKRKALQLWCYLATHGYPTTPLDLSVLSGG